jgi:peptide/nickel transport system substrate-binding protein
MGKKVFMVCFCMMFLIISASTLFAKGKKEEAPPPVETEKKEEMKKEEVPPKKMVKNPDTMIYARYGTVQSLDPHRAYDTSSGEAVMNMYDTLIAFDGPATDRFVPMIAEKVPSIDNGLIRDGGRTYVFPIKRGIKFHNGAELTPADVEYSFERALVTDQDGGPIWMFYEPLLGVAGSRDGDGNLVVSIDDITQAVEVEGQSVVFHLNDPYPPFLGILAQYWSGILNKEYMITNGAWDGKKQGWERFNNPDQGAEALYDKVMGTGPYKLVKWEPGVESSLIRFDGYFMGPAPIKNVVIKIVEEWTTRKLMFTAGDADMVQVDTMYWPEMDMLEGVTIYRDLPRIENTAVFFNFDINPEANQAIWSVKLDGQGVPSDFFSDINVRKAFAYCFDHDTFVKDAWLGFATTPNSPVPKGLPYRDDTVPIYEYNLDKAREHFKKAWGGKVWENGFKLSILYNTGNEHREIACQMIEENVESLNPKFQIEIMNVDWGNYLNMMVQKKCPLFIIGWVMDFPDPHNFVHPYMHSQGTFAEWQSYNNTEVDGLVRDGIKSVDKGKRQDIYYKLERTYYQDVPGFMISQSVYRVFVREWITGYYWNPARDQMMHFYMFKKGY